MGAFLRDPATNADASNRFYVLATPSPTDMIDVVGLLDEGFFMYFEDVDFCLRVRAAGYRNLYTPHVQLYHFESKSRGYENTPVKALRFKRDREWLRRRWLPELLQDPAYNPNLTLNREDFQLADADG